MKKRAFLCVALTSILLSSCSSNQHPQKNIIPTIVSIPEETPVEIPIQQPVLPTENSIVEVQPIPVTSTPIVTVEKKKKSTPIENFANSELLKYSNLSFYAVDLDNDKVVGDYRGENIVVPASVMKIITSATALEVFGADKRLETKLVSDGKIDANKILHGNLYIIGGGDPTLGSDGIDKTTEGREKFLKDWTIAIKKAGIHSVQGDIIVIDDLFGYQGIPESWLWEDMGTNYAPGVYGISVFDNLYTLYLTSGAPGTKPQIKSVKPKVKGLNFNNQSVVSRTGRKKVFVRGIPLDNDRVILGEIPANQKIVTVKSDIPNPGLFLGQYFKDYLKNNGVIIKGDVKTSKTTNKKPKNPKVLYVTKSAPMSEIIDVLLTRSDNHYTETLFQLLRQTKNINIIDYWKEKGIDVSSLVMKDGSGLSRSDYLSAKLLVDILNYMDKNSLNNSGVNYESLFPTAGKEGTVSDFLMKKPINAKIKSGSMSGIQSYAGYINKNGKRYAFAITVNHWDGKRSQLKKDMESLILNTFN